MSNFQDLVRKYRQKEYDYSCSEATLRAANENFDLGLNEDSLRLMAGFSGGMYIGGLCGINSASVAVLSHLLTEGVAHQSPKLKPAIQEYYERYNEVYSSNQCSVLKEKFATEEDGCNDLIVESSKILEEIILKYKK